MPRIFGRKSLAHKDMAQMPAAARTDNFGTPAIGIGHAFDRAGNFIVKARPATARIKFIFGTVELRLALPADIRARRKVLVEFAAAGVLGAFIQNDARFFFGEGIELHTVKVTTKSSTRRFFMGGLV